MANQTSDEVNTASRAGSKSCEPPTLGEAKARFLIASRLGPGRAIQKAPWKSVGLALGAGLLLGYCQPLRKGLYGLGKLSLKGLIAVLAYQQPGTTRVQAASTDCRNS